MLLAPGAHHGLCCPATYKCVCKHVVEALPSHDCGGAATTSKIASALCTATMFKVPALEKVETPTRQNIHSNTTLHHAQSLSTGKIGNMPYAWRCREASSCLSPTHVRTPHLQFIQLEQCAPNALIKPCHHVAGCRQLQLAIQPQPHCQHIAAVQTHAGSKVLS